MEETISVDMLTPDSVSIRIQKIVTIDGVLYPLGEPQRCAYINSQSGRQMLMGSVVSPYKEAVLSVWGSTPTVADD